MSTDLHTGTDDETGATLRMPSIYDSQEKGPKPGRSSGPGQAASVARLGAERKSGRE